MLPEREFQYAATSLLGKCEKDIPAELIETMEFMLVTKSWWDTVDTITGGTPGDHFKRFPAVKADHLARWRESDNFWFRRACILFPLN